MTPRQKSLTVLTVQLLIALAVAGKLGWDRASLPRVWARTIPVDPDDPLRGRYVRLWVDAADRRGAAPEVANARVEFFAAEGQLAVREAVRWPGLLLREPPPPQARGVVVAEPMAFFIPEHAPDPSRPDSGMDLWVEVSVPRRGLPRPIRIEFRPSGQAGSPSTGDRGSDSSSSLP
jgi:hypothetical protein